MNATIDVDFLFLSRNTLPSEDSEKKLERPKVTRNGVGFSR
jgi:hypothetical protein